MSPPKKRAAPGEEAAHSQAEGKHHQPGAGGAADPRQTEGYSGSRSFDDDERPRWEPDTVLARTHDYQHEDGTYSISVLVGRRRDGEKAVLRGRRVQGTNDLLLARQDNELYRLAGLDSYRKGTGDEPDLLYRLPELIRDMAARPDDPVFICEGEKDTDRLRELGLIATTNPNGALNWKPEFNAWFAGRDVVVLVDNDDNGRMRAAGIIDALAGR